VSVANRGDGRDTRGVNLVQKAIAEEHHLEEIARDGYAPATMPIVLAAIMVALTVIVGISLAIALVAYYWA
jgi:hypothetical protein